MAGGGDGLLKEEGGDGLLLLKEEELEGVCDGLLTGE